MQSFFITGGLGFMGFHIAKDLLKNPDNKIIIYDTLKYFLPLQDKNPEQHIQYRKSQVKDTKLIKGDCLDKDLLYKTLENTKPDVIFHLSSLPIPKYAENHKEEAWDNIYKSTINLLETIDSIDNFKPHIIYASSSMVYGDFQKDNTKIIPASENQECFPQNVYGKYKLETELYIKAFCTQKQLPYTIIRPTAIYGPTDFNRRITEIFVHNALNNKPIYIDNRGLHQLDFSYIDDVVKGFIMAAKNPVAYNETFNISYGQGRKIAELAETVAKIVPGTRIISRETSSIGPIRGALNIEKAKNLLGYSPKYSLEEGIEKYINFVKNTGI